MKTSESGVMVRFGFPGKVQAYGTLFNIRICVSVGFISKVEFWVNDFASLRTIRRTLDDSFLSEFLAGSEERATFRDSY